MLDRVLNATLNKGFFVVAVDKDEDSFFFSLNHVYVNRLQKYQLNLPKEGPCSVNVIMWLGLAVVF